MDKCIYDSLIQCSHDCDNCKKKIKPEPDWDKLRDLERDEKLNG